MTTRQNTLVFLFLGSSLVFFFWLSHHFPSTTGAGKLGIMGTLGSLGIAFIIVGDIFIKDNFSKKPKTPFRR